MTTGLTVFGTITQDYVDTPGVRLKGELGGSAVYSALAARHFGRVAVVGVVGEDREAELRKVLSFADLTRIKVSDRPTYRWRAKRSSADGPATTLERFQGADIDYHPNLGADRAKLPSVLFLASADPDLQLQVARAVGPGRVVAGDTMDIFIEGQSNVVREVARRCEILFLTEQELVMLSGEDDPREGARSAAERFRLRALVLKLGAGGAELWTEEGAVRLAAVPVDVVDPTGAGDALAGGFLGRLSQKRDDLRGALVCGLVAASFAIEGPGVGNLAATTKREFLDRLKEFWEGP